MNEFKKLIPRFMLENGQAVVTINGEKQSCDAVELCKAYDNNGADEILLYDISLSDAEHDKNIGIMKDITRTVDCPVIAGGNIRRLEDIKKYLYAGARAVLLDAGSEAQTALIKEGADRFGKEKIVIQVNNENEFAKVTEYKEAGAVLCYVNYSMSLGNMNECLSVLPLLLNGSLSEKKVMAHMLAQPQVDGMVITVEEHKTHELMLLKHQLKKDGISLNTFESSVNWRQLKLGSDGLIPVIIQDYKTSEVLMMAYMNEEAFAHTLKTGKMTYYSRSRQSLWVKGETSGHYQYVKSLHLDCDNDTILAKVSQVGAACHTGSRSCFFQTLAKKDYDETNPLKVFEDVYGVIMDRKVNPKEGSYTNYLFDKGIDKILKKVGEEATEIVIAAKNPDPEEIKYEISDFLYHVMVLMAEKGVSWEDITKELANR